MTKKGREHALENRLMKQVKIKNEFLNETEKNRKRVKKVTESASNRGWQSITRQNLTE